MIDICGTEFDLEHPASIYVNCDCMDGMKQFPDKYFDLAVVDPPYGIGASEMTMGKGTKKQWSKGKHWDDFSPKKDYFNELFRVSKQQIIFGGNYFELPKVRSWLVWDKGLYGKTSFADCEMIWTNINTVARIIQCRYDGFIGADKDGRIHPTQKPIKLYEWILTRYAKEGDIILDTHVGSASSLISCRNTNHKFVGFELDEYYYKLSKERLDRELAQMNLFDFMGG